MCAAEIVAKFWPNKLIKHGLQFLYCLPLLVSYLDKLVTMNYRTVVGI